MLNITKNFEIADVINTAEDDDVGMCIILRGEASYNGQNICTITNGEHRNHVEIVVHYVELDGEPDWWVCDMEFYQIGDDTYLTDNLPKAVQDWFWDVDGLVSQAAES